jgi:hypothetical protein
VKLLRHILEAKYAKKEYKYLEDEFKDGFPVVKDLHNVRAKGVEQEEIMKFVNRKYGLERVNDQTKASDFMTFYEVIYSNRDQTVGTYFGGARMGIPTVKVGVESRKAWTELRKILREKGLAR